MRQFDVGDIVYMPFPFSDLTGAKERPAVVLAVLNADEVVACSITSQKVNDQYAIPVTSKNMIKGSLTVVSNIRPNRLFTADTSVIIRRIGALKTKKLRQVMSAVEALLGFSEEEADNANNQP